jgi:D-xylulose reductase
MKALVLEPDLKLNLREIEIDESLGPRDVRIQIHTVGICASDVHYYQHGRMGQAVVESPMILGHEAAGTVIETGPEVRHLKVGDRVCMEPGVPDPNSKASRLGKYNLDPTMRFWATPPTHGCLRPTVVHPEDYTFAMTDNVSFAEGAMVEPLAIGMHAATQAKIKPGDFAVVLGAGTIGAMTALSALAGGCSRVVITDVRQAKLDLIAGQGPRTPVNVTADNLTQIVMEMTDGWGADIVFECSGNEKAITTMLEPLCHGGRAVLVGVPAKMPRFDIFAARVKEVTIENVRRYAHVFDRSLALMSSGKIDVKPFLTDTFDFADSVKAFEWAVNMPETSVKAQILLPQ